MEAYYPLINLELCKLYECSRDIYHSLPTEYPAEIVVLFNNYWSLLMMKNLCFFQE